MNRYTHGRPRSTQITEEEEALPPSRLRLPPVAHVRAAPTIPLPPLPQGSAYPSTSGGASEVSYHARGLPIAFSQACLARGITSAPTFYQGSFERLITSTPFQAGQERGLPSEATLPREVDNCSIIHADGLFSIA